MTLAALRNDLARCLRLATRGDVVITRRGRPAGVLIGFADDGAWSDYRLESDPRFTARIAAARASIRAGRSRRLEDLPAGSCAPLYVV